LSDAIDIAAKNLLSPSALSESQLVQVLDDALDCKIDAADLFLQNSYEESWFLENGIVKAASYDQDQGFGLRAMSGETVGFAFGNDFSTKTLSDAARNARAIARGSRSHGLHLAQHAKAPALYSNLNPLNSVADSEKITLMQQLDKYLRKKDSRVCEVMINLSASYDVIMVLNSDGQLHADLRPLVSLRVSVVVEENGSREKGSSAAGWRSDYNYFVNNERSQEVANEALRQATINLTAQNMIAGEMPVVLGPGWPAVLLHEAVGHGLEGDFNRKGSSIYSNCLGEKVASSLCTIVDDGTLPGRRGSLNIDDEGCVTQCTTLIENGILKNYMLDSLNARLMGMKSTGNGRRESYAQVVLPRMTNTYMLPGKDNPQDIISSVEKGLYAVNFSGGQVDITSGTFVFSTSEAYYIENGKIKYPVKGATLIGNGPEVLKLIDRVGNDLEMDKGTGFCGKAGQTIEVGVGQPTLRVSAMTVGGMDSCD
jgi:TldD protein